MESNCDPVQLRDRYKNALDYNDKLYVGQVSVPTAWTGYSKEVTDWIKEKLSE